MASQSDPSLDSLEYQVIQENSHYLIGMIKQSPESVGDKLFSKGFLSRENRDRMRENTSKHNKARLVIDGSG